MRTFWIILILCISQLHAQQLKPACQIGATWNYIHSTGGTLPVVTSLLIVRCIKDTPIGNHLVSVLAADAGNSYFTPFTYLAKDDSNGLYFFPSYRDTVWNEPMLTFRFDTVNSVGYYFTTENDGKTPAEIFLEHIDLNKEYSNNDSVQFFVGKRTVFYVISNPIHPKYLNLGYGTIRSRYFGIMDFSNYFDSDHLDLNCYTDSSGTTKFIKAYANEGCDYVGLRDITTTKEVFTVFPNPCSNRVYIRESIVQPLTSLEIRNLYGESIYFSSNPSDLKLNGINTSDWSEGIYFITLQGENDRVTKKLVVNR